MNVVNFFQFLYFLMMAILEACFDGTNEWLDFALTPASSLSLQNSKAQYDYCVLKHAIVNVMYLRIFLRIYRFRFFYIIYFTVFYSKQMVLSTRYGIFLSLGHTQSPAIYRPVWRIMLWIMSNYLNADKVITKWLDKVFI